jgi:hypothetical protein
LESGPVNGLCTTLEKLGGEQRRVPPWNQCVDWAMTFSCLGSPSSLCML